MVMLWGFLLCAFGCNRGKTMAGKQEIEVEESGGHVSADQGLASPEQKLLKARLTLEIHQIVKRRRLTQKQAGEMFKILLNISPSPLSSSQGFVFPS